MTTSTVASPILPPPSAQATLLESYLRRLRLPVVLARYPKLAQEAARQGLAYEQFLLLLAEQELAQRDENTQRRRIGQARFPTLKTLDQYDFSLLPQLNRPLILELAHGHYDGALRRVSATLRRRPAPDRRAPRPADVPRPHRPIRRGQLSVAREPQAASGGAPAGVIGGLASRGIL